MLNICVLRLCTLYYRNPSAAYVSPILVDIHIGIWTRCDAHPSLALLSSYLHLYRLQKASLGFCSIYK